MMVRKSFSPFWQLVGSRLFISLSSISLRYLSQLAFLKVEAAAMRYTVDNGSLRKLMRIGRWSEPRFVFVCQLVEVIREDYANETHGEDRLALFGSLLCES